MKKIFPSLAVGFLAAASGAYALTHARSYSWDFKYPTLIANWSFENVAQQWLEDPAYGVTVNSHFKAAGVVTGGAKTGSFVAKVSGTNSYAGSYSPFYSDVFSISPNQSYTLSFYYQTSGTFSGTIQPKVLCASVRDLSAQMTASVGTAYTSSSGSWTLYVLNFTSPSNTQYAVVRLCDFAASAQATLYFDNVILEEGTWTSTQEASRRQEMGEAVAFGDGLGRTLQLQSKATKAGDVYLVAGSGFDNFARPETTYLPTTYTISAPAYQTTLATDANNYYGSSGPFNAESYPYARVKYSTEPASRTLESSTPGAAWQFGAGHTVKSDYYFVQDTAIPANIESPSNLNAVCKYRFDWAKNPDSSYTLKWTNKLGQVVRSAVNIDRSVSGANNWKWAFTRYQYYPSGALKRTLTPLDENAGDSTFAEYSEYDAQGNVVSSYSPDRRLRKFWYDRQGRLRYSQDEEQRSAGEFEYREYDVQGRLVSQGIQVVSSLPQDSVDKDSYNQGSKIEQIGYIYDDSSTFASRTGFSLQAIMGNAKSSVTWRNASGALFCKYNRNLDNVAPKYSLQERFVAAFYSYNDDGLLEREWKYLGAIKDTLKRVQDSRYFYDDKGRLAKWIQSKSAAEGDTDNVETYSYDFAGRVDTVKGRGGIILARYDYGNSGPLSKVTLGGLASGDSSVAVEFFQHSQGGLREIRATGKYGASNQVIFQQLLGYEGKAYNYSGVPTLLKAKYDGSISQQVYKYTSDMNSLKPVRAVNYGYDQMDRMLTAGAYLNTNATPLDANQNIIGASLTMSAHDSLSSLFQFDLNGRVTGQRSAGTAAGDSAQYYYASNSYELDHVTGKLSAGSTRSMSASGSFVYDANGALLQDKSKKMAMTYGWDGLPVSFAVDSAATWGVRRCCVYNEDSLPVQFKMRNPTLEYHNFYDADGNRVTRVMVERKGNSPLRLRSVSYVYTAMGMAKEWREEYGLSGKVSSSQKMISLMGATAQIGRIRIDGKYEYFIKNHLGSTILTVDDRGRYDNGRAMDYLSYGSYRDLKVGSTDSVTQKFTGKEYETLTSLYTMGARWLDPELGMFISGDPGRQYFNPFSYGPNSPINGDDPTGMIWNPFNPDDWSDLGDDIGHNFMEQVRWTNGVVERLDNKVANHECHWETNEQCRDRITSSVSRSGAVGQLKTSCQEGDEDACAALKQIGFDVSLYGIGGTVANADRKLGVYIMDNGSHTLGINLSLGGGVAAASVQYDDVTIPLGFYDFSPPAQQSQSYEILLRDEIQNGPDATDTPTSPSGTRAMTPMEKALRTDFLAYDNGNKLGGETWASYAVNTKWKFVDGNLTRFQALNRTGGGYAPLDEDGGYANARPHRNDDYVIHSHPSHPYPTYPQDYVQSRKFPGESLMLFRPTGQMYMFDGGRFDPSYTLLY